MHPLCDDDGVKINFQVVVFDAADLAAESAFWAGVLGGTIDAEADWHGGGRPLTASWRPTGAEARAAGLGAVKEAEDGDAPDTFQVYADPAGHPFCLCWVKS